MTPSFSSTYRPACRKPPPPPPICAATIRSTPPSAGTYLIRVNHQGGSYFIAAPQAGTPANINVYDVAAKLDGVAIDADMLLLEAAGGMLRVQERYLVRNTSLPPKAQFSSNTFEIVIPSGAELDGASSTRPGGIATTTRLVPLPQKGHYTFNVPIQPDQGEKETLFQVQYHLPYSGEFTFTPHLQMAADNLVVYAAKGISFHGGKGASFQATQEDPRVQTYVAKNISPAQAVRFTISGEGQMPREAQAGPRQANGITDQGSGARTTSDGPLDTASQSSGWFDKYKWWILAPLILLFVSAAAFFLRKRNPSAQTSTLPPAEPALPKETQPVRSHPAPPTPSTTVTKNYGLLLGFLKDELFAIEREKLSGALSPTEYSDVKKGLDALLKRALKDTP